MISFLFKLLNSFQPREGWVPLLLLLAALLSIPAALFNTREAAGTADLILLTALAVVVGLRFARSRLSARQAAILGGLLGAGLAPIVVGRLMPPFSFLWTDLGHTFDWLRDWLQGVIGWPLPFASSGRFILQQLNALGIRLWWWGQAVAGGSQTQDQIVLLILTAFLVWASALFATWQIYRRRSALVGLVPSGATVTIIAFFRGNMSVFYLLVYLFSTLWLLAICHLWTDRERWERTDTDYPDNLGTELALSLGPLIVVVLLLAATFPVIYSNPLREGFWRLMDSPWSQVEQVAERFFGPIESGYRTGAGSGVGTKGDLPRSHLLGGRPELGETIVLYVSTNDPPPPPPAPNESEQVEPAYPRRYWRGQTYDTYTGQGWDNGSLEMRPLPPSQLLEPAPAPGSDLIQQFQQVAPSQGRLHTANAPYRLDQPVQAWWRAPGDLAQLTGEADFYTVLSRAPQPTIAELRDRSPITATLPPDIASRYLALPDTTPRRVLDLAHQVAGDASTRYDRAWAIERYLRAYPYTLDLPDPPTDRDLVDYFLFDLQKGYCDYYASAMVVMARAVGVPARLASGYAQGTYDHDTRHWVVTEKDGHSWVEVYFEGLGWVEFEPTAGLPALVRSGGEDLASLAIPPLPPRHVRWWQRVPWGLVLFGGLLLLLVTAIVWLWRPRRAPTAAELIYDRQARLGRWGTRLGHPFHDGQTAHEYSQDLSGALSDRGQRAGLPQARRAGTKAPGEIADLTGAFVRSQYSSTPITERESWQIRDLWSRLRRHLWWLWLALGLRKDSKPDPDRSRADET